MPTQPFPIRKGESPPKKTLDQIVGAKNHQLAKHIQCRFWSNWRNENLPFGSAFQLAAGSLRFFFWNMIIRVVTGSFGNPEGFQKILKILVDFELESFGGRVSVLNSSSVGPPSRPGCMLTHMLISYLIKGRETTYGLWFGHLICLHEFLFGKLIELWTPWEGLTVLHPWKLRDGT